MPTNRDPASDRPETHSARPQLPPKRVARDRTLAAFAQADSSLLRDLRTTVPDTTDEL
jgi:hypothetical protein